MARFLESGQSEAEYTRHGRELFDTEIRAFLEPIPYQLA